MKAIHIKALVIGLMACTAAVSAHMLRPTQYLSDIRPAPDLEQLFPKQFGEWSLAPLTAQVISPDQKALLDRIYAQTLSRSYRNAAGEHVMLSVAYGGDQSDGMQAHRPEVCYPAQGFQVLSDKQTRIQLDPQRSIPARQLVAQLGARIEPITYWIVVGDQIALSGTQQKLAQMRFSMRGVIPDGMLIRISTIDQDTSRAYAVQQRFVQQLDQSLTGQADERVFGDSLAQVDTPR